MPKITQNSDKLPGPFDILEGLPLAIIVIDKLLQIRMVNSATEQLLGVSSGFLILQNITDLVDEDAPLISLMRQVFEENNSLAEFGLSLGGPKIRNQKVDVQIAVLTETSDFAVATIQECSLAMEMNSRSSQGRSARAVAGLASIFAQEIKNPLSGIKGAAQLLEQSASDSDRELTRLICTETDRIRDLLDKTELFSNDRPLTRTAVNIHDVLKEVKKLALSTAQYDVSILEEYDPSLPLVFGNRDQLIQVFLNLTENAYEALVSETGTITFETSYRHSFLVSRTGSSERLELPIAVTISDTGAGIPEDLRQTVFEPFVTTKPKAAGLGLALVAKVIDDHGGIVELNVGEKNTKISVYLPVCPDRHLHDSLISREVS